MLKVLGDPFNMRGPMSKVLGGGGVFNIRGSYVKSAGGSFNIDPLVSQRPSGT